MKNIGIEKKYLSDIIKNDEIDVVLEKNYLF